MKQYEGIIEMPKIENTGDNADQIGTLKARFVRYPSCQQLTVWLPEYGGNGYGHYQIKEIATQKVIENGLVAQKINGSVQMLWDSIGWSAGQYLLDIEHPKGGKHCLFFNKLKAGAVVPKDKIVEMPTASADNPSLAIDLLPKKEPKNKEISDTMWTVYQDGFGNIIPNQDRDIREEAFKNIAASFSRRIEFEGTYRSGYVTYIEGDTRIRFLHEMYGGGYHMGIDIPTESQWEKQTNTPLSKRQEILDFLAKTVQREQAPSWKYEIRETDIAFY
jgi:hypothetical protein